MWRSIFIKTLRDNRWGTLGVGLGATLYLLTAVTQYPELKGSLDQMAKLLRAYSFALGAIVSMNTVGGFLTVRILGVLSVYLALWAVIVAAGLIRGEEEQGALDVLLATPHSRWAVFWQKMGALGAALGLVLGLVGAGLLAGLAAINETIPLERILTMLCNMALMAALWSAVTLLFAQMLATRRATSTLVGGLVLGTYLLNNLAEGLGSLQSLTWVLPFHYYALNKPLVPDRAVDYAVLAVLAVGTIGLLGLALGAFVRRDIGGVFGLLPGRRAANAGRVGWRSQVLLGSVFAKNLRDLLGSTLGWGTALALYGAMVVGTANEALAPTREAFRNVPLWANPMGDLTSNESYLSLSLFMELPLVLTFFALLQLARWTGDEESGRLEVLVSEPLPRLRILLAHYGAVACSLLGALVLTGVGILVTAALTDTPLKMERVTEGLLGAGVLALLVLAFGLAIATWLKRPGTAVPLTGGLAISMYLLDGLGILFAWPEGVRNLSVYHLYGRPVVEGLAWGNMVALLVATLLLAGASLAGFARRDIVK